MHSNWKRVIDMARRIKVRRTTQVDGVMKFIKDKHIDGCVLVAVEDALPSFPKVAKGIIHNTYYRVWKDTKTVRGMVTIMPDKLVVAWDMCSICSRHITDCNCPSGMYHTRAIAFIRATYEAAAEGRTDMRGLDYSEFYNTTGLRTPMEPFVMPDKPVSRRKRNAHQDLDFVPTRKEVKGLSVKEIEAVDFAELGKIASEQAETLTRKTRSVIRGKRK